MWIGIFVAVLFVVGQASEVDRCQLDGENACRDYSTAEQCHTTNYCKAEIWNQPINKNTNMCQMCLRDITNLQNFNIAKTTREFVKYDLLALCKSLPFDEARTECTEMVNENFDKVHREIVEQLDPNVICRALHICLSQEIEEAVMKLAKEPKEIESMGSVCALDSRNGCYDSSSAKKCGILAACKATVWSGPTNDDKICEMCKQEVQKLENWIKQGSTKAAIEKDLMDFCDKIPVTAVKDECKKLISDDFDMIYDDLIALVDPSTLCTAMRLCTRVSVENYVTGMMDRLPSMLQRALDDGKLPVAAPVKLTKTEMLATSCSDCEAFMRDFQNTALNNKKIVDDWLNMLKTECQTLGEGLGTLCEENVEMLVYSVMTLHRNNSDDPKAACQRLMMCNAFAKKQRVGDMCTDCKTFFTDWQEELKNNPEAIDQIVHAVSAFYCLQKPEHFREQCTRYVSMVIKVLIEKMERENVDTICKKLEFCSPLNTHHDVKTLARKVSKRILQSMPEQKPKVTGEPCADCKNFITDLQGVIQNNQSLVQELVDLVKQECEQLGPELSEVCHVYVDENYEKILQQFASYDVDTICTTIMMCSEVTVKLGGDLCTDCIAFFGDWQTIIMNNQSVINAALKKLKEAICSVVPTTLRSECDNLFDEDSKEIVNDIIVNDPEDVCATLYFCDDYEKPMLTEEPKQVEGEPCPDCKNFITDLQGVIQNNQTLVQELVVLVKLQCDQLGIVLSGVCRTYVEDNYRIALNQFAADDVGTICTTIDMCSQSTQIKRLGGGLCTDCVAFFGDWQTIITNNKSIITDVTNKAKDAICSGVPEILKSECDNLFDEDCGKIINAIKNNDPGDVCAAMYFCDAKYPVMNLKSALIQSAENPVAANEFECQACQFVIEEVEIMIEENRTEEAISNALKNVCELYGEDIRDDCEMFIQQYGADIIDFLLQELNSLEICTKLGLCESAQKFHLVRKEKEQNLGGEIECDFCTALITEVDKILENKATEKEILDAIAAVCSYLGKEEDECNTIVHEYGPRLIELIAQKLKPSEICAVIKACVKAEVKTIKVDASTECTVCQLIATELDNLIKENSTEDEIEKALKEVCSILPSSYKTTCDSLVEEFGPEIVALLAKELAPNVICVQLKLCSEATKKADVSDSTECEVCKLVAMELDKLVNSSSTEAEIEKALESICNILPSSIKDTCNSLVTEYGPEIVQLLIQELAPDVICKQLKLCTEASQKIELATSQLDCEVCILIVRELDNMLPENSTRAEIKAALEEICTILPSDFKSTCDSLVKQYGSMIIDALVDEFKPSKICAQIKLCPQATKNVVDAVTDCQVCQWIAQGLDDLLKQKATQAEIEAALKEVCAILPSSVRDTCSALITDNWDTIVAILVAEMQPNHICVDIKVCPTVSSVNKVKSQVTCELCELVMGELDTFLKKNSTQEEIKKFLEKICSVIPGSAKNECMTLITQYGDAIIDILLEVGLTPAKVCPELGICPASDAVSKVKGEAECDICQVIVKELDIVLDDKSTEADILNAVNKICDLVPKQSQAVCHRYINDYGPGVIDILVHEIVPSKVCAELHACVKKSVKHPPKKLHVGDEKCSICKEIITMIDRIIKDNVTIDALDKALEQVCNQLPESLRSECVEMVDEIGPMLAKYIDNIGDPAFICQHLKLCPTDLNQPKILGVDPCTYGPSYWCKDLDTARSCNAVTHCMNHVW